jgi:hypothetical protein
LLIGPVGRGSGSQQAVFYDFARHGPVREIAHGAPPAHIGVKVGGALLHFIYGIFPVFGQGDEI